MSRRAQFPLTVRNITVDYRQPGLAAVLALNSVSIPFVCEGQRIAVTGPNGAGKSTLISALSGRLGKVAAGAIGLSPDEEIRPDEMPRRFSLGYVPQTPSEGIVPSLSVRENLLLPALARVDRTKGDWSRSDLDRRLLLWLSDNPAFKELAGKLDTDALNLSGGYQQMLCLAANLFDRPDILFLDEPTSRLAPNLKREIWDALSSPAAAGLTLVYASHDLPASLGIAHRQIVLENGRVTFDGTPERGGTPREGELVDFRNQLPLRLTMVSSDWWKPGRGNLFGEIYKTGDDSKEGYRSDLPLCRAERTAKEVAGVRALVSKPEFNLADRKEIRVLDVPCGFGRHSLELASLGGFSVTGLDLNSEFLRDAQAEADKLRRPVRFVPGDMRELPDRDPGDEFDLVLNLYSSFGFFLSENENVRVLEGFCRSLRSGGLAVIHMDLNPRRAIRGLATEPAFRSVQEKGRLFVREIFCREDSRLYGVWDVLYPNGENYSTEYSFRLYSETEWLSIAAQVGFEFVGFYGALSDKLEPLNDSSSEFVVVLRRP